MKIFLAAGVLAASAGTVLLVVFLAGQGLVRASLWVTVWSLGLTVVGTAVSIWGLVAGRRSRVRPEPRTLGTVPPSGNRPGAITQASSGGTNIAHTGEGDINVSGLPQ
jgi:hypothetical protein